MSDDRAARAAYIKQVRREILISVLSPMYHIGPLSFPAICNALAHLELPDDKVVQRDLTYLIERGYASWVNQGSFVPWAKRLFKITANGNDFADAIADDPNLSP